MQSIVLIRKEIQVLEDRILVYLIKRGTPRALGRLYEKYRLDLLRVALGLLFQREAAEDVVHEVFMEFAASAGSFKLTGNLKAYLMVCTANKSRRYNRTRLRQRWTQMDEIERPDSRPRPEQWLILNEELERVNQALHTLPYEQKEVVILHVQGKMKFREIAALQGVSTPTVLSRYRYGIDKLRSFFNGELTQ